MNIERMENRCAVWFISPHKHRYTFNLKANLLLQLVRQPQSLYYASERVITGSDKRGGACSVLTFSVGWIEDFGGMVQENSIKCTFWTGPLWCGIKSPIILEIMNVLLDVCPNGTQRWAEWVKSTVTAGARKHGCVNPEVWEFNRWRDGEMKSDYLSKEEM